MSAVLAPAAPRAGATGGDQPQSTSPKGRALPTIAWVGLGMLAVLAILALGSRWFAGYRITELSGDPLEAPSAGHLLGTNAVGQDVASQLVHGARMSLFIALVAGAGTVVIGALIGTFAGWRGGRTDAALMRVVDLVMVTPSLPLLIVLGAYAGPSITTIALIIAATSWPPSARVIRAQVLSLRGRAHLQAAVSFGARTSHVMRHHIFPEVGLIVASAFVGAAGRAVMIEAGLAFLGLGDPTRASWGRLLRDALDFDSLFETDAWAWWLVPPVAAIALLMLALAFVGIGIEQRINPRVSRHTSGRAR